MSKLFSRPTNFSCTFDSAGPIDKFAALSVDGGVSIAKSLFVGGPASFGAGLQANGKRLRGIGNPVDPTDGVNLAALQANADQSSIETDGTGRFRIASSGIGAGLVGGSGVPVSVPIDNTTIVQQSGIVKVNPQLSLTSITTSAVSTFQAGLSAAGSRITNVGVPMQATDAATMAYVDAARVNLSVKDSALVATTAPGNISVDFCAGKAVDGVTLQAGNIILIKDQTNAVQNGLYVVQMSGAPVRTATLAAGAHAAGAFAFVQTGAVNSSAGFTINNTSPTDVVDTHALNFIQFSGAGEIIAGDAMTKRGNQLDVAVNPNSLEIVGDQINVKSSLPTVTSLGTLTALTVAGNVSAAAAPSNASHLVNKSYVDNLSYILTGSGLVLQGNTISINTNQPGIVSVGTLTSLTVAGLITASTAPTAAGHLTNKAYVDALGYLSVGSGLNRAGSTIALNATQTFADVTVTNRVSSAPAPLTSDHLVNKGYIDSLAFLSVGAGLAITSGQLSLQPAQTFTSVTVTNAPTVAGHLANKAYVDALGYLTAGAGLTLTSSTLSIAPVQNLTSLTVTGSLSNANGPFVVNDIQVAAPIIANKSNGILSLTLGVDQTTLLVQSGSLGVNLALTGLTNYLLLAAYNSDQTALKGRVTSLEGSQVTAGTGLTRTGNALAVNTSQTQITAVGTLTSLQVSGATSLSALSATGQSTLGALSAGASTLGALTGTSATFSGALAVTGNTTLSLLTAGASTLGAITGTTATFSSTLSATGATTLGILNAGASTLGAITGSSASFSGGVSVAGVTTLGQLTAGVTAVGALTGTTASFSGNIGVSGSTTLGLLNAGTSTLGAITASSASLSGALSVTGATTLAQVSAGPFTGSTATFSGTVGITGALTGAAASFSGTLSGTAATFSGNVGISSTLSGTAATFSGTVGITGALTGAAASFSGTLSGTAATFSGNVGISGTLSGTAATFSGNVGITGSTTLGTLATGAITGSTATLSGSAESLSVSSGAMQVAGGVGIGKSLFLGSVFSQVAGTYQDSTTAASGSKAQWAYHSIGVPTLTATNTAVTTTSASTLYIAGPPVAGTNQTLTSAYAINVASGNSIFNGNLTTTGTVQVQTGTVLASTANPITSTGGALNVGGDLVLGATNPRIFFPQSGFSGPSLATRSSGAKLVMYPNISATGTDYAIGIDNLTMWYGVMDSTASHKWYAGATQVMGLSGTGSLSVTDARLGGRLYVNGSANQLSITNANVAAAESSIAFFANVTATYGPSTQTGWVVGHNVGGVGAGNFAISSNTTGNILESFYVDGSVKLKSTADPALQVAGGATIAKSLTVAGTSYLQTVGGATQFVDGLSGSTTQLLYPPTGNQILTGTNTTLTNLPYGNGSYYIAASSTGNALFAYMAFQDRSVDGSWSSDSKYSNGTYTAAVTTTSSTGTVYGGEYVDVSLPQAKFISSVTIYPRTAYPNNAPTTFAILGGQPSASNSQFVTLFVQSTALTWTEGVGKTFTLTNPGQYAYLRIVGMTKGSTDVYLQFTFSLKASNPYIAILPTTDSTLTGNGALQVAGGVGISKSLYLGSVFAQTASTFTDTITAASSTKALWAYNSIGVPTLTAANAAVTTTTASTVYIAGPPVASTNQTIGTAYSLNVASGNSIFGGKLYISGSANQINVSNGNIAGGEASISFFSNTSMTYGTGVQSAWIVGNNIGVGTGNFAVSNSGYGNVLEAYNADGSIRLRSTVDAALQVAGGVTIAKSLSMGGVFAQSSSTYTDATTAASAVKASWMYHSIGVPTLVATNTSVTTTSASTLYIAGAPIAGTNNTITNAYSLNVAAGNSLLNGTLTTKDHTPLTDNSSLLGSATLKWSTVNAVNSVLTGKLAVNGGATQIQVGNGNTAASEASIGFFGNTTATYGTGAQTGWAVGNNVQGVGAGNFAIYNNTTGNVLEAYYVDGSIKLKSTVDAALQVTGGITVAKSAIVSATVGAQAGNFLIGSAAVPSAGQGHSLTWNLVTSGQGNAEFVNYRGGGVGGWAFWNGTGQRSFFIDANGATSASSDRRWKNNVETIKDPVVLIQSLRGVSYNWKTTGTRGNGFIAQEVETVLPEAVATDGRDNGYKSVEYNQVIAILVEAVKTQQREIDALRADVAAFQ